MKKARLATLALSGAMLLSSSMPALAAEPTGTVVGFSIAEPCVAYTMTIPTGNTSIATDGTFSSIGNLTVTKESGKEDFDSNYKVEVTVNHGTQMVKTGATSSATTAITYDLYTGDSKVDDNKVADGDKIEFSAEDINATGGKSVAMGVALSGTNFDSLVPGEYRDTITFSANPVAVPATVKVCGYDIVAEEGQTWTTIAANNEVISIDQWGYVRIDSQMLLFKDGEDDHANVRPAHIYSASVVYRLP